MRRLLYHTLKHSYQVLEAGDAAEALAAMDRGGIDIVLLDMHLPPALDTPEEGLRVHCGIRQRDPLLPVVVVTGDQDRHLALEMVDRGIADFLLKPIDADVLLVVVARSLARARAERELQELRRTVRERSGLGQLIGSSPAMRHVFATLRRLAATSTTVLLLGETGTGKSVVARALHQESARADGPFVVVDGATIPESLLESELFGHVRGAYTGASAAKIGRLPLAEGGTLFLDEIANLSLAAQGKLLLFLDSHRCTAVGSEKEIQLDVRLIAATNQDLESMVREGRFRADLLYRIQVAAVTLPPLRERVLDIGPLASLFVARLGKEMGRPHARLSTDAIELLESCPWPGNVRQLKHVLEGSLVLAERDILHAADLVLPAPAREEAAERGESRADAATALPAGPDPGSVTGRYAEQVAQFERDLITRAMEKTGGNKSAAGRLLGLDDNQIRYLCRKHSVL